MCFVHLFLLLASAEENTNKFLGDRILPPHFSSTRVILRTLAGGPHKQRTKLKRREARRHCTGGGGGKRPQETERSSGRRPRAPGASGENNTRQARAPATPAPHPAPRVPSLSPRTVMSVAPILQTSQVKPAGGRGQGPTVSPRQSPSLNPGAWTPAF